MSSAELKIVKSNGKVDTYEEYGNSWGGHAFIWDSIYKTYLKNPTIEYDNWMTSDNQQKLWDSYKDPKIPTWVRTVMCSTFDHAIVEFDKLIEYADMLDMYSKEFGNPERVDHLPAWAKACRDIHKKGEAKGICFYATSVSDDPWCDFNEESEEYDLYDINTGDKHFFVFESMEDISKEISE